MSVLPDPGIPRVVSILVENEAGALARVVGLFSARGYNIDSLTVAPVDGRRTVSRITIETAASDPVMAQIRSQLLRLVPVLCIDELTREGADNFVRRELALVKVRGSGEARVEALRLATIFRANVIDTTSHSFIFEISGEARKINAFVELMKELGMVECCRTGAVALSRGAGGLPGQSPPADMVRES